MDIWWHLPGCLGRSLPYVSPYKRETTRRATDHGILCVFFFFFRQFAVKNVAALAGAHGNFAAFGSTAGVQQLNNPVPPPIRIRSRVTRFSYGYRSPNGPMNQVTWFISQVRFPVVPDASFPILAQSYSSRLTNPGFFPSLVPGARCFRRLYRCHPYAPQGRLCHHRVPEQALCRDLQNHPAHGRRPDPQRARGRHSRV